MAVLREILMSAVRAGDPLAVWSAAARLLRSFYPLITPAGQSGLASSLGNSADRLPSGTRCPDPALPFIRLHSFPMLPSQMDIIKRNPAKKEWWTGSAPSGPFIYTPFTKILLDAVALANQGMLTFLAFWCYPDAAFLVSHAVEDNNASTLFEGKNQNSVISIAHGTLSLALPLNPGAEVTFPVTVKAWKLNSAGSDHDGKKSISESLRSASTEGSNPLLVIHYAGSSSHHQENSEPSLLPGRRLVLPLQICVLQGLHFVQARLLPMEVPSHVDNFAQIDPHGLSRLLHLLELELSNPTNVTFEVYVSIETEHSIDPQNTIFPKTRIDPGCISHVLIPLQHLKLLVVDDGFFAITNDALGGKVSHLIERNLMAELAASVTKFISKVEVRWLSGGNISGELSIKDVVKATLQKSLMDIFLPEPLTFQFRLTKMATQEEASVSEARFGSSISVHEMTDIDVVIRNNTREMIQMNLTVTCRDVAEENCLEGHNTPVLWAGVLSAVGMEIPPLEELVHSFSLYFLVPGEYTLLATAVVDDANLLIRARTRTKSPDDPNLFRGSPFRINVTGTT
ncbi:hypothetical protein HPP92_024546 [Vanilla planifolia]|uniref:Trs120/TRAPPC9 fourth Ig-like domain-containing protein n=1 Tax=Vanilla planifolia TaxID=51239 RepID=A0A835UD18_VANPL|nr:hypothetical protein HPP92_024546 [Vanilla planifolia]